MDWLLTETNWEGFICVLTGQLGSFQLALLHSVYKRALGF